MDTVMEGNTHSRRRFLREAALTTGGLAGGILFPRRSLADAGALPLTSKMNILFIVVDDLTTRSVGAYGNPAVRTPNLDRLAQSGVKFTQAYCQSSVCNPSRASFTTGLRPPTTRVWGNTQKMEERVPEWAITIPEHLKSHPIQTIGIGKLFHHNFHANKQSMAFDRIECNQLPKGYKGVSKGYSMPKDTPPNPERSYKWHPNPGIESAIEKAHQESQALMKKAAPGSDEWLRAYKIFQIAQQDRIGDSGQIDERSEDGIKARFAAQIFQEMAAQRQQFFMSLAFTKPHTPLLCPREYLDLYDPEKLTLSPATVDKDREVPPLARRNDGDRVTQHLMGTAQETLAAYYACTSFMDAQLGLVLDALEGTGLEKNTVVIYVADHGFQLGEHGLWCKNTLFEQSTRVPLVVRVPRARKNGSECPAFVELVDLFPTVCDLLGTPYPHQRFEGLSLLPLMADLSIAWKKCAFSSVSLGAHFGHAVRSRTHRYTKWEKQDGSLVAQELYDIEADPWEQNNLAGSPRHSAKLREMDAMLKAGWKAALPANA
jgi:arylsulfatase A-like enzyme